jgi:hypothetical protein
MYNLITTTAVFKKPNLLVLDKIFDLESSKVKVTIEPVPIYKNQDSILGIFEGKFKISPDFDDPIIEY